MEKLSSTSQELRCVLLFRMMCLAIFWERGGEPICPVFLLYCAFYSNSTCVWLPPISLCSFLSSWGCDHTSLHYFNPNLRTRSVNHRNGVERGHHLPEMTLPTPATCCLNTIFLWFHTEFSPSYLVNPHRVGSYLHMHPMFLHVKSLTITRTCLFYPQAVSRMFSTGLIGKPLLML